MTLTISPHRQIYRARSARAGSARWHGDDRLKIYDGILQQIGQAIPSDTMIENSQIGNAAKNAQ
jgi:hypothetical protein